MSKLVDHFKKILTPSRSPNSIAIGFAVGTFIAMLPTFGFGPLISFIIIVPLFPKINKISLFGAFVIWNPLIMVPFYYLNYVVGGILLHSPVSEPVKISITNLMEMISTRFIVGSVIVSSAMAIICYMIVFSATWFYQERSRLNNIKNKILSKTKIKI